jgi:hypothetical protein
MHRRVADAGEQGRFAAFAGVQVRARDVGLIGYNPCERVERNNELPRDCEALAWEVEALSPWRRRCSP